MPLSAVVAGSPQGEVIVMMSGFPDNHSVWTESIIPHFSAEGKYKIVALCMPDYDLVEPRSATGYTFDEIQTLFSESIAIHVPVEQQFTLVAHDWGCFVAQTWADRNSARVKRMILLDVLVNRRDNMLKTKK
jgi:pimeloyl-ACP methyl ester carboxylesterase